MTHPTAPFEPCIICLRGDTTTAFAVAGGPEMVAAALHVLLDIPVEEAIATTEIAIADGVQTDPTAIRLCSHCAERRGVPVGLIQSRLLPCYRCGSHRSL